MNTENIEKSAKALREEKLAAARQYINHKAEYVPADELEFRPATVIGASIDSRGNVLVALRTEDGKRVTKKYGSKLLRLLDEMAEKPKRNRVKRPELTEDIVREHRERVGLPCVLDGYEGRVRGVQIDRRSGQIYLVLRLADGSKRLTKIDNEELTLGEPDETTDELRAVYASILEQRGGGQRNTPEKQVLSFGAGFLSAYKTLVAAGTIEETPNLVAVIEYVCDTVRNLGKEGGDE